MRRTEILFAGLLIWLLCGFGRVTEARTPATTAARCLCTLSVEDRSCDLVIERDGNAVYCPVQTARLLPPQFRVPGFRCERSTPVSARFACMRASGGGLQPPGNCCPIRSNAVAGSVDLVFRLHRLII